MMLQPRVRGFLMAGGSLLISWMYRWPPLSPAWSAPGGGGRGLMSSSDNDGLRCPGILAPRRPWHAGVPVAAESPALAVFPSDIDHITSPGSGRPRHLDHRAHQSPRRQPHATARRNAAPATALASVLGASTPMSNSDNLMVLEALARWRAGGRGPALTLELEDLVGVLARALGGRSPKSYSDIRLSLGGQARGMPRNLLEHGRPCTTQLWRRRSNAWCVS